MCLLSSWHDFKTGRGEQKAKTKLKLSGMDLGNFRAVLEGELGEFWKIVQNWVIMHISTHVGRCCSQQLCHWPTISCNIECELCLFRQSDRSKLPWAWYLKTKLSTILHFNTNFLNNCIFKLSSSNYSIPAKDWVKRKPWWAIEAAH